jgi:adenylate kinase
MVSILADLLDSNPETANGVIFDGFPRTINQAIELKKMLSKRGSMVHAVIGLEVEDEELIDRLIKRGKASGRADDNLETIKQRLKVYHSQTSPLRDYYINENKYLSIKGSGNIDDIFNNILQAVNHKLAQ